jgi:hypothetical protein
MAKAEAGREPALANFLSNQLLGIWAADLFVVQTLTFQTLYVFFFIGHERRELLHFNVTGHPTLAWVWQQLLNATPEGTQPCYLIHFRDGSMGRTSMRGSRGLAYAGSGRPRRHRGRMPSPSVWWGPSGGSVSTT